jgi:predicted phosphodiesterase
VGYVAVVAVRVVQVSDTHLSERTPEAAANWQAIVDYLERDPPDLVVNTGDISLNGADDLDDLQVAFEAHTPLTIPWRAIPGNHDIGDVGATGQPIDDVRRRRYAEVFGDGFWVERCGEWDVVGVDIQTLVADPASTWWTWLADVLSSPGPTMLCLHRPLMPFDDTEDVAARYVEPVTRDRLGAMVRDSSVQVMASGHVHQAHCGVVDGVTHVWAPSTWATIPDEIQPVIGSKVVGVVEHTLGDEATSRVVVPDGVGQYVVGQSFPSPYRH